jgi:hypothetical protein
MNHFKVKALLEGKALEGKALSPSSALDSTLKERTTKADHFKFKAQL